MPTHAQEPISVFFPPTCNITLDPLVCPFDEEAFLEKLFSSPKYLPAPGEVGEVGLDGYDGYGSARVEELDRIKAGTVMRLIGLKSAPQVGLGGGGR